MYITGDPIQGRRLYQKRPRYRFVNHSRSSNIGYDSESQEVVGRRRHIAEGRIPQGDIIDVPHISEFREVDPSPRGALGGPSGDTGMIGRSEIFGRTAPYIRRITENQGFLMDIAGISASFSRPDTGVET